MINEDFSEIFHSRSLLTRDRLSFSETSTDAIHTWASSLPIMQLGDTSESILNAIHEISELNCSETLRFDLIQVLHPFIVNVLSSLERNFLNQGLSHTIRNEHIIELTTRLRALFANIYTDIASRSHDQLIHEKFSILNLNKKRNLKTARTLATYYALQQLGFLLVQQQMLYSNAFSYQWLNTHFLFELAIKNNEHLININQLQGTQHTLQNIQEMYAQVVLLNIFNTHQIRPSEIQALYECSLDWATMVQISRQESTLARYIVDTSKDYPPIFNKKQHESFQANFYISTQKLLEHINSTIQSNTKALSKNEKIYLSSALKFHVQNALGTNSERQHDRYEYSAQLQICFSLATAHFYLSKAKNFEETLTLNHHYKMQTESNVQSYISNSDPSTSTNNEYKILDREIKQIYQAPVIDISITGYRIRWPNKTPKSLKTGEFILVNESLQNKWKGAVIRWIKQSINKTYEVGIEVLAQDIYPCAVKTPADQNSFNFHPCLMIHTQQTDENKVYLILPNLPSFKEHKAIFLRLADKEIKIYLIKTLSITQSFIMFDFELLDDEQQTLVDQFIQKQAMDMNNQDVWESLK